MSQHEYETMKEFIILKNSPDLFEVILHILKSNYYTISDGKCLINLSHFELSFPFSRVNWYFSTINYCADPYKRKILHRKKMFVQKKQNIN